MEFRPSRRRWLRGAGLAIIACVLGLYAWRTSASYQARLVTAAEMAAMCARLIEERIDRVFDKSDRLDLTLIEPLLIEAAGRSGIAAILEESGRVVTAQPQGQPADWLAAPIARQTLTMPLTINDVRRG